MKKQSSPILKMYSFVAKIIPGRGVGKTFGFPTLNFEIPQNFNLEHGVFAVQIFLQKNKFNGVLFFGTRKTFDQKIALEIHVLDAKLVKTPNSGKILVFDKIREVQKFTSYIELSTAIKKDCTMARRILT